MTTLEILTIKSPVLRQKCRPVTKFDNRLQQLIDDMIETMREAPGVGLAAPQVNETLQLAIIETSIRHSDSPEAIKKLFVIVNPKITRPSQRLVKGIEGCLSIPGYVGEVVRHESIRVYAQNRYGKPIKLQLSGWPARIFQHEIDHLNGTLFIDRLTSPSKLWAREKYYEKKLVDISEL